jgi:hypothetical protein
MIITDMKELEKLLLKWIERDQELLDGHDNKEWKSAFGNQIIAFKNVLVRISPGYAAKWAEEERIDRLK